MSEPRIQTSAHSATPSLEHRRQQLADDLGFILAKRWIQQNVSCGPPAIGEAAPRATNGDGSPSLVRRTRGLKP